MAKLGYTWYPKDWGNSESVFELNLSERGLYRELIDLAMLNDNIVDVKIDVWSRKFGAEKDFLQSILDKLLSLKLINIDNETLSVPSCESRLNIIRGGAKGGKVSKPISKGIAKPISKPMLKPISKGIANQIETKRETKRENNIDERKLKFADTLKPFLETYGKDMLNDFFKYWTEPNNSGTKFRREMEKTWDVARRLETWAKRDNKFQKQAPQQPQSENYNHIDSPFFFPKEYKAFLNTCKRDKLTPEQFKDLQRYLDFQMRNGG